MDNSGALCDYAHMPPPPRSAPTEEAAAALAGQLLTFEQTRARLNVTDRWLRRAVAERRLPVHRLGRLLRFDERDIEAYLASTRETAV